VTVDRRLAFLSLAATVAAGCAGPGRSARPDLADTDLRGRLAARAAAMARAGGGPFVVHGQRFSADCSGFVDAVYEAEGIPLRRLRALASPGQASGVASAWAAVSAFGDRTDRPSLPAPGDLVFFHDTWDRNGNGRVDDPLTHVGVVESVDPRGTVSFLHRGGSGVVRAVLNLYAPGARADGGGELNSYMRRKGRRSHGAPRLAGQLFAGFGRIDPSRLPAELLARSR
jgi:cell wall-associated NlpC family hydrolase